MAKTFATHRRIVHKSVRTQEESGAENLPPAQDRTTRLDPRQDSSGFGSKRPHYWLTRKLKIEIAISTIAKYPHKHKRTKEHLKRSAARSFDWKSLPLFSALQVDTKETMDATTFTKEEKWLYKHLGLPLY